MSSEDLRQQLGRSMSDTLIQCLLSNAFCTCREIPDPQTNVSKPGPYGGTDLNRHAPSYACRIQHSSACLLKQFTVVARPMLILQLAQGLLDCWDLIGGSKCQFQRRSEHRDILFAGQCRFATTRLESSS